MANPAEAPAAATTMAGKKRELPAEDTVTPTARGNDGQGSSDNCNIYVSKSMLSSSREWGSLLKQRQEEGAQTSTALSNNHPTTTPIIHIHKRTHDDDNNNNDDCDVRSNLSTSTSSSYGTSSEDYDDHTDDEEETRLAQKLVQAAFSKRLCSNTTERLFRSAAATASLTATTETSSLRTANSAEPIAKRARLLRQTQNPRTQPLASLEECSKHMNTVSEILSLKAAFKTQSEPTLLSIIQKNDSALSQEKQRTKQDTASGSNKANDLGMKPQEYFLHLLETHGLPTTTYPALSSPKVHGSDAPFFQPLTPECIAAYDGSLATAARNADLEKLRALLASQQQVKAATTRTATEGESESGAANSSSSSSQQEQQKTAAATTLNWRDHVPRNKFGESIVHTAARRGTSHVMRFLLEEAQMTPAVCCDSGRTPLHDACWTCRDPTHLPSQEEEEEEGSQNPRQQKQQQQDVPAQLIAALPDLLYLTDRRGFPPLAYVPPNQWAAWRRFLDGYFNKKDDSINDDNDNTTSSSASPPSAADQKPRRHPLQPVRLAGSFVGTSPTK